MTSPSRVNLLASDLDRILAQTQGLWEELRGQRIFITGGTGFFGCWLLESFAWANDRIGLNAEAVVLTRNANAFQKKAPYLAHHPAIRFHAGDVRNFEFPDGCFSHVIHAATDASATLAVDQPLLMFDTICEGTRRTLEFARHCGAKKFLLASSGAVYGRQPATVTHIPENYEGAPFPTDANASYGEGKRAAELLGCFYARQFGFEFKIARCFAFVGPYLSLDGSFAIGNFIRDALKGGPIQVNGDGTPYRSYLYASDLTVWLWTILFKGQSCQPFNVGSERAVQLGRLAQDIAQSMAGDVEVRVAKQPGSAVSNYYVPSTAKARNDLGLLETVPLRQAIDQTIAWNSSYTIV
jgi:dTDP-glucose 4,6-dehydratase